MLEKEISLLQHRIDHLRKWHIAKQNRDMSPTRAAQVFALEYIEAHPGCKQTEISEFFNVSRATVTKSIQRMVNDQLIEREVNEDDERKFKIFISDKGKATLKRIRKSAARTDELSFRGFTAEEKKQLKEYLNRMKENLETEYSRGKSAVQLVRDLEGITKEEDDD